MKRLLDRNVYDAANERIEIIFKNFERIYVSFSGGKDSAVCMNLCIDYIRKNKISKKLGVLIMDNECNFNYTKDFMHSIIDKNLVVTQFEIS